MLEEFEIATKQCFKDIANNKNEVDWNSFVLKMAKYIEDNYPKKTSVNVYKGQWRHLYRRVAKQEGLCCKRNVSGCDNWDSLNFMGAPSSTPSPPALASPPLASSSPSALRRSSVESSKTSKSTTTSSTSTTNTSVSSSSTSKNVPLTSTDLELVRKRYNDIPNNQKWTLSTGKVVEDQMLKKAMAAKYQHPVHSLILDLSDKTWGEYFDEDEQDEISNRNSVTLPDLPEEYESYIESYKSLSAIDIYQHASSTTFHPIKQHDLKWIQQTMSMASNHFLTTYHLDLSNYTEHDLQHKIWPFMYQLYSDLTIVAKLGEKSSEATAERKNCDRCLESERPRMNKIVGAKLDILYKYGDMELGCAEFGRGRISPIEEKYMNDGMIKLPKTLRDMLSLIVGVNNNGAADLLAIGYVVMGVDLQLVAMNIPHGHGITRISRSRVVKFPQHIGEFVEDIIEVLHLVWAGKQLMLKTTELLKHRKRKRQDMTLGNQKRRLIITPSLNL